MSHSKYRIALIVLFLAVVALRLTISFQTALPDYKAYDELRQIESISHTGKPLYDDPLSYQGKERIFPPLFHYILWLCSLVLSPIVAVKVIPNIFAAAIIFPVFYLTKFMTSKKIFAFISACFAGIVPAGLLLGINDASTESLTITLLFTAAFFFLKSRKSGRHLNYFLTTIVIMALVDSIGAVLLAAIIIFIALQKIERITVRPKEIELLWFYLFFSGWITLIIYKKALIAHGASVIWQNIPLAEASNLFSRITLLEAVGATGLIPLIAGVWGLYYALTNTQMKSTILLTSIMAASIVLLWFRLIPLNAGLLILSISLCVVTGYLFMLIYNYMKNTKVSKFSSVPLIILALLFIMISIPQYASYQHDSPSQDAASVLQEVNFLGEDAVILSVPQEGSFISYMTSSKNVMDEDYLLATRVEERYEDVTSIYREFFKTQAIATMEKYGAKYLFVSQKTLDITGVEKLQFIDNSCFVPIAQQGTAAVYELSCTLRGGRR